MPEANKNKNLLKGTWGAQIEWSVSLITPLTDRLIAIFRFSFDPLPDDDTPGTFNFYSATNHGGNVRGKIVNGVGDFNSPGAFSSGRYSINADGTTGWLTLSMPPRPPSPPAIGRFSFVITNKTDELLLSLTELPLAADAPPATTFPLQINSQAWGIAKRD